MGGCDVCEYEGGGGARPRWWEQTSGRDERERREKTEGFSRLGGCSRYLKDRREGIQVSFTLYAYGRTGGWGLKIRRLTKRVPVVSLHPRVRQLMQVVEVVLAPAASSKPRRRRRVERHPPAPSIVHSHREERISPVSRDGVGKVLHGGAHVVRHVLAVASGGTTALVLGALEHALLAAASDGGGVAGGFLHGEGGDDW